MPCKKENELLRWNTPENRSVLTRLCYAKSFGPSGLNSHGLTAIGGRIPLASVCAQLPCTHLPRQACTAAMRSGSCTQTDAAPLFTNLTWIPKPKHCLVAKQLWLGEGGAAERGEGQSPAHGVRTRAPKLLCSLERQRGAAAPAGRGSLSTPRLLRGGT